MVSRPRVLVTGANGFIGSNACRHLLDSGFEVFGTVRATSDLHFLDGLDVRPVVGDLRDIVSLNLPPAIDYAVHAAALVTDQATDEDHREVTYGATVRFAETVMSRYPNLRRFVFISTALVLGYMRDGISPQNPGRSAMSMPYVRHKKLAEDCLLSLYRDGRLPVVILRPSDVYGPNDRLMCAKVLRFIESGGPPIVGHGRWRFGYCYVDNLSQAIRLACTREGIAGRAFTVTNGQSITWRRFLEGFLAGLGRKQTVYVPTAVAWLTAGWMRALRWFNPNYTQGLTAYRVRRITSDTSYDISDTVAGLGYQPSDDVDAQIRSIVEWYKAERAGGWC